MGIIWHLWQPRKSLACYLAIVPIVLGSFIDVLTLMLAFTHLTSDLDYPEKVGLVHYYHVCYEGCLANFDIGREGEEATQLYPEVKYVQVKDYLRRYL